MGFEKEIIKEGKGRTPNKGEMVVAHYVGTLEDGLKFDSSRDKNKPLTFLIGIGSVIKGWDEGIMTMKLGERAKLTCTPDFGYGAEGSPPLIPPNATLIFDVEVIGIGNEKLEDQSWCIIS